MFCFAIALWKKSGLWQAYWLEHVGIDLSVCRNYQNIPNGLNAMTIFANWPQMDRRAHTVIIRHSSKVNLLLVDFSTGSAIFRQTWSPRHNNTAKSYTSDTVVWRPWNIMSNTKYIVFLVWRNYLKEAENVLLSSAEKRRIVFYPFFVRFS